MSIGKAAKRARNLQKVIQPKLEARVLTDDFYDKFKKRLNLQSSIKFKMYVYNYELFNGMELTKKEWLKWINDERKAHKD